MARYNASELTTVASVVGHYDYVVNIQKFSRQNNPGTKLSYAVGVLVHVQFVLTACSVFFKAHNQEQIQPERKRYKDFRAIADGATGHFTMIVDGPRVRFFDKVVLHPKCAAPNITRFDRWVSDLSMARTSFSFLLDPGHVGLMKFGNVTGGAKQLEANRTREFNVILKQHMSVVELGNKSFVCRVMTWGKYERVPIPTTTGGMKYLTMTPCPRLLLFKVKLDNEHDCEAFCDGDHGRFCDLQDVRNIKVDCAYRGDVHFVYQDADYSSFPCVGTEGSPLMCHPPGKPKLDDIYGIVSHVPIPACLNKSFPLIFTQIDDVSEFVKDVIGEAVRRRQTYAVAVVPFIVFVEYIIRL